jgi:hypothetical protein
VGRVIAAIAGRENVRGAANGLQPLDAARKKIKLRPSGYRIGRPRESGKTDYPGFVDLR